MRVGIHIHHYLLEEVRVVILRIQVQRFAEQGDVKGSARSVVPSLILVEVTGDVYTAAACQEVIVLGKDMIGAIPFSGGKAEVRVFVGIVLYVETGRDKVTVLAAAVTANTAHKDKFIIQIIGVLHIRSRNGFLYELPRKRLLRIVRQPITLIVGIVVETQSRRQAVTLAEFRLEQKGRVGVVLVYIVQLTSVHGILLVQRAGKDERQIGILLLIEDVSVFGERLVTVGSDGYFVGVGRMAAAMAHLPAVAVFGQGFDACLENVTVAHIRPAVPYVVLLHLRNIGKAVIVAVVGFGFVFVMRQQRSAPTLGKFHRGVRIGFVTVGGAAEKIDGEPVGFGQLRLLELHIDLPGDGLVTVFDGCAALAHLYALHPRTGHIAQPVRSGHSPKVGNVFRHHLYVSAGQSQQLDLLGARSGIGIGHVHRRVGYEALSEVATSGAGQFGAAYHILIHHAAPQFHGSELTADNIDFAQFHPFAKNYVERFITSVHMYRIVLETDEADYQHVLTGRLCEGEAPVGRGGGALCRSHPEKVGSGNRFTEIIFYRSLYLRPQSDKGEEQQH